MRPGGRTKPCVADWNCDGKLDLLVGDYLSVAKPDKKLTPAERSKLAILEKREAAYQKRMFAVYEKLMEKARREAKVRSSFARMTIAESKRLSEASMRLYRKDASLQKLSQEGSSISRALAPLRSAPEAHGFVWVYLRA
jgi:hypothetical protein